MECDDIATNIGNGLATLNQAALSLQKCIEGMRQKGEILDLEMLKNRAAVITMMRSLHTNLQELAASVAKNGMAAEYTHNTEIKAAREELNRVQVNGAPLPKNSVGHAGKIAPPPLPLAISNRQSVRVTENISVSSVVLPTSLVERKDILAAITGGELYFIPSWNHFAIRLGQCVLHAGIGRIYRSPLLRGSPPAQENPVRVKECRRGKCGTENGCRYYHDPEEYPGSTDIRNYMVDSWLYSPPSAPARYGTRRFGSDPDLDIDIKLVTVEDARRFLHQTAHDVICAVILWQHVVAPAGPRKKQVEN